MAQTELSRYRVLPGKEALVAEWMAFLQEHLAEVLLTLEQEKMYVEAIFQEVIDDTMYLYWFSIQGEGAVSVADSTFEVDKQHLKYWEACIDPLYGEALLETNMTMIPEKIATIINE